MGRFNWLFIYPQGGDNIQGALYNDTGGGSSSGKGDCRISWGYVRSEVTAELSCRYQVAEQSVQAVMLV